MHNKWILLGFVELIVVTAIIGLVVFKKNNEPPIENPGYLNEIGLASVHAHNTASSCWIIVDIKVFDVTPYIASHPNEDKFSAYCGKQFPLPTSEPSKELADLQKLIGNYYIGLLVP